MDKYEVALYRMLEELGIRYWLKEHPPIHTIRECWPNAEELGATVCKNLFLCNRNRSVYELLLLCGEKPFRSSAISKQAGDSRLSFATEQELWDMLHLRSGVVSPLALIADRDRNRIGMLIDRELLSWDRVLFHPYVNTKTLVMGVDDLLNRFLPAVGHTYRLVDAE